MLYQLSYTPAAARPLSLTLAHGNRRLGTVMPPAMHEARNDPIPAELLLSAYRAGIFPMADGRDDPEIFWVEPRDRAIIPLDGFRFSRSLAKAVRQDRFQVTCDTDFAGVMQACAAPRPGHPESWISARIEASYVRLHEAGHAHSIECRQDGVLVGGLYGVQFGGVFCGESMFSKARDASKVALAWLVAALRHGGSRLLDCQFMTGHLASLGAVELSQEDYLVRVMGVRDDRAALPLPQALSSLLSSSSEGATASSSPGKLIAQSLTQTS